MGSDNVGRAIIKFEWLESVASYDHFSATSRRTRSWDNILKERILDVGIGVLNIAVVKRVITREVLSITRWEQSNGARNRNLRSLDHKGLLSKPWRYFDSSVSDYWVTNVRMREVIADQSALSAALNRSNILLYFVNPQLRVVSKFNLLTCRFTAIQSHLHVRFEPFGFKANLLIS